MLLLRCPSRSFTVVGDRAQARHGFAESWQERLERVGLDHINLASLTINYRTPEEVMAEAEPVIRAVASGRQRADLDPQRRHPRRPRIDVRPGLDPGRWLAANPDGIACVIGSRRSGRPPASGR